ncbi:hypothetical protein QBC35DRAFT_466611 [Podospora australis]|uniref:BTB domain-containing protein n=1 Tax=Podospora australis TaxID=1536484 RepID=A0AAN7AFU0_9PEZI|nr:hypothetical protein QBC35DRAFT_466611 [Podospora australis]
MGKDTRRTKRAKAASASSASPAGPPASDIEPLSEATPIPQPAARHTPTETIDRPDPVVLAREGDLVVRVGHSGTRAQEFKVNSSLLREVSPVFKDMLSEPWTGPSLEEPIRSIDVMNDAFDMDPRPPKASDALQIVFAMLHHKSKLVPNKITDIYLLHLIVHIICVFFGLMSALCPR